MLLKEVEQKEGEKIWSLCVTSAGAKRFFAATEDEMWTRMQQGPRNYSEIIQDKPCHLFFDLDEGDVHAKWKRLEPLVNAFLNLLNVDYHHIVLDASKGEKRSLHVITRASKFVLASPTQGKQFVKQLETIHDVDLGLDTTIYTRNRCFRMLGNSKYGADRPLRGEWSKTFWLKTLVQPNMALETVLWAPAHVPVSLRENTELPECANEVLDHIGAVRRLRMPMSWTWTGQLTKRECKLANRTHHSNNNYYVFHMDQGVVYGKCHACEGRWTMNVPSQLLEGCRTFLRSTVDE